MPDYLALVEVDQRQKFILSADKLREMLGASRIISETVDCAERNRRSGVDLIWVITYLTYQTLVDSERRDRPTPKQSDVVAKYRAERIRREQREWNVMLIAYGDDSFDETKTRVFAAGGVVARQEDWDAFLPSWKERNPVDRPFHATDCDSDRGDFKNRNHADNKRLYADNVRQVVKSPLIGAGVAISIPDYWDLFPFAPADRWWPYYMCFAGVIACISKIARLSIPPEDVHVTFDLSNEREVDTARIYDFIRKQPSELSDVFKHKISFGNHREEHGLQVADLLARETMKDLDNRTGPTRRWPRQSMVELRRSNRFDYVHYDREKLTNYRIAADRVHADPEKGPALRAWLDSNGISDSIHARLRFIAERSISAPPIADLHL